MNESDKRVRRQWLGVLVLSMLIAIIGTLLQVRFDPLLKQFPVVRYLGAAFSLLGALGAGFAIYHCSYRKPGTKVLTFYLIVTGISFVATPILYLSGKIQPPVYIPYYGAYLLLTQGMGIYWAILCWKMRKINQRLRVVSSPSA